MKKKTDHFLELEPNLCVEFLSSAMKGSKLGMCERRSRALIIFLGTSLSFLTVYVLILCLALFLLLGKRVRANHHQRSPFFF